MTEIVVDASVTAAWCFEDEETFEAREILSRAKALFFVVPAIWPVEMANVLLVNERRGRITAREIERVTGLFRELDIRVDQSSGMRAFDATMRIARAHKLSAYDASYLELAIREGRALATLDKRLRDAAASAGAQLYV